jgi:hypothetical protein
MMATPSVAHQASDTTDDDLMFLLGPATTGHHDHDHGKFHYIHPADRQLAVVSGELIAARPRAPGLAQSLRLDLE